MNRVCEILNIEKPVIQGPMAWISTAPLVAAVSNAGGLGVLGVGFAPEPFIREQIAETRKLTDKPFGMNVIMIPPNLEHVTKIVLDEKPPVMYADTIAGLDLELCKKYFDIWHSVGCKIVVKASFIDDARIAAEAGADVMIVKGWEGGGHVTFEATTVLVPQAVDLLDIPVVASGGIADGRGVAAGIAMGAEGFEMGTAFMAAAETTVHPNVKKEIFRRIQRIKEKGEASFIAVEAALLLEEGYQNDFDTMWYVYVDEATRIERLKEGRGYTEKKCHEIMAKQLPEEVFRK